MLSIFRKKAPKETQEEVARPEIPLIVPRVRNSFYLEQIRGLTPVDAQQDIPIAGALVGDIVLLFGIDQGSTYRMVTPHVMRELGMEGSKLRDEAIRNLPAAIRTLRSRRLGCVVEYADDEDMVACLILLADFWKEQEEEFGGGLVGIFPFAHSAFVALADQEGIAAIRERMSGDMPLSDLMYRCENGLWRAFES